MVVLQEQEAVVEELLVNYEAMDRALIIFQRKPELGKVKTRLAKTIGDQKAMDIYMYLLSHTHKEAQKVNADIFVFFNGGTDEKYSMLSRYFLAHQSDGNLGHKMEAAFSEVLNYGYKEVLIIGSDCYELESGVIDEAFNALTDHELVIGPAVDGGYYLLGMKKLHFQLFRNKPWSNSSLYELTSKEANSLGLKTYILPTLRDVDEVSDLGALKEIFDIA